MTLEELGRRSSPLRADSRGSRSRLIDAVGRFGVEHQQRPLRLTDLTSLAGVSPATAYRHFRSVDDAVDAFLARLPEYANAKFQKREPTDDPVARFHQWNEAWVASCQKFSSGSIGLRSPEGFLARRKREEPVVIYVCVRVEPLLGALSNTPLPLLLLWNALSDPREVLDMRNTLRWSSARCARFITDTVLAATTTPNT